MNDVAYKSSEQYLHVFFSDNMSAAKILAASTPAECKKLGETVDNFDLSKLKDHCKAIMKSGLSAKFSQNLHCFKALEATNDTVLVKTSPYDKFWGAGLSIKDTDLANMQMYKGKHLMGEILQQIRNEHVG